MNPADALRQTAFEILEDGLFLILDPSDGPPTDPVRFTMAIDGDGHDREVGIEVAPGVGRELAANLLGIDLGDVSPAEVAAAAAEALNMVAGRLMALAVGPEAELELHPPIAGGTPRGEVVGFGAGVGRLALWYAA